MNICFGVGIVVVEFVVIFGNLGKCCGYFGVMVLIVCIDGMFVIELRCFLVKDLLVMMSVVVLLEVV